MGHTLRAVVALVSLITCVACGSTSLSAARPTPSPSASPSVAASPSAGPSAVPTAAPAPDYGPPPVGVDLFYVQWPASPTWLIGFDWTGKPRATVHLKQLDGLVDTIGSGISVAPNGSAFASAYMTFDRLGNPVYQGTPTGKGSLITTWSDDSRFLCGVEESGSPVDSNGKGTVDYYLAVRPLNGPAVRVTRFLHLNFVPGDMGYSMAACSGTLNRALLVRTVCCSVQGAMVLRLSDGALLGAWSRGVGAGQPIFSPDGQEVAEPTLGAYGTTSSTEVRLVLGGTVLARYGPGIDFQAFSGDNRFAVVTNGPQVQVIQVSNRRVVWRDTTGRTLARVVSRPGSGDMVLAFTVKDQVDSIIVVHADGSSAAPDGQFLVPMSWGY